MKFIDEATISVQAGDGGRGCVSFRREARVPMGGPDGGDGGDGGSVLLIADPQLTTLIDLQYRHRYPAEHGEHGRGKDQFGRKGQDTLIHLPMGTMVYDATNQEILCDLKEAGQRFIAAQGGRGGHGNKRFATSTNQAPRTAQPGEKGEARDLKLTLKLLANVGLVGFPNAGKSTLISKISRARPKIADYPFTTLIPHLGTVKYHDQSFVVADIPGLIEGAHKGIGLGDRFLKHIERTALLVFLIDLSPSAEASPSDQWKILKKELQSYDISLTKKHSWVVGNKIDLPEATAPWRSIQKKLGKQRTLAISALTGENVDSLVAALAKEIKEMRKEA
ncbi:MAG: GTPase ObgE [Deltaproteobacteria bacterium]|nr:GTPase ObgE [Deltaproteobacteria bacterium]